MDFKELETINTITFVSNEIVSDGINSNVFYIRFYDNDGNDNLKTVKGWKFITAKLKQFNNRKIYQNIDFLRNSEVELYNLDIDIFQNLSIKEKLEYCDIISGNLSDKVYRDLFLRKVFFHPEILNNSFNLSKIWFLDIEVFRNFEYSNPEPTNPNHFINSIAIYSTVSDTLYLLLYENEEVVKNKFSLTDSELREYIEEYAKTSVGNININIFNSEVELIKYFNKLVKKELPEVISGWNVFFDINFIVDRVNYLNCIDKNEIFICGYIEKENFNMGKSIKWYLPKFINVIDYLSIYKLYNRSKPEKFSLDAVGEFELGINKVEFEDTLDILYRDDINLFVKYNIIDTVIVKLLDDKLKLIDFIFRLSQVSLLPVYKFNFKMIGKIVEGVIFRYSKQKENKDTILWIKNSLLNKKKDKEEDEESYKGAFVKQPEKSGCFYYISDLDATSLYPTIISNFNISPETFICKIEPVDNKYSNQEIIKIIKNNDVEKAREILVNIYDFYNNRTKNPITLENAIKIIKMFAKNFSITDNLSIFIFNKDSIYKNIVKDFKVKRKEAKNKQLKLMQLKEVLTSLNQSQ